MTASGRGPIIAALIAVLLGLWLRWSFNNETFFIEPVQADAAIYYQYAINLIEHGTFSKDRGEAVAPDANYAAGYPIFLAANLLLSDSLDIEAYDLILHSQVALAAASIWVLFLLGRLFMPAYWPVLPALLLALSPHHVSLGAYALTETLFGFTLLAALYYLAKSLLTKEKRCYLYCGLSLAAAYLVNPVALVVIPAFAVALWIFQRGIQIEAPPALTLRNLGLLLLPLLIVSSLWSLRSYLSVPPNQSDSSDRLLANLTVGLYPDYHEKWKASVLDPESEVTVPGVGVDETYASFFSEAYRLFSDDPVGMLGWYAVGKPYQLWQWNILTGQGDIYIYDVLYSLYHISQPALASYAVMHSLHPWLLISALLGAILIFSGRANLAHITVPILSYAVLISISAVYILTQSEPRYSVPLRPELYLVAVFFIWQLVDYLAAVRARSLARHKAQRSAT